MSFLLIICGNMVCFLLGCLFYVCEAIKKEEPVLFNGKQVKSTDIARSGRADNCPLIEVPEPHGRLGDLDRLEQMFADIDNAPYSGFDGTEPFYSAEDAAQIIRLAPTVIEASESNLTQPKLLKEEKP